MKPCCLPYLIQNRVRGHPKLSILNQFSLPESICLSGEGLGPKVLSESFVINKQLKTNISKSSFRVVPSVLPLKLYYLKFHIPEANLLDCSIFH